MVHKSVTNAVSLTVARCRVGAWKEWSGNLHMKIGHLIYDEHSSTDMDRN